VRKFNKPSRPAVPSFGVGTKRFVHSTHTTSDQVGPGSYDPKLDIKKIRSKSKNIAPKDSTRFPIMNMKKIE